MSTSALLRIRPALSTDKPAMLKALHSALRNSNFHNRCFPSSDPTSQHQYTNWIDKNMADPTSHVIIAEEASSAAPIAGWARWVRRPAPGPDAKSMIFTASMFPAGGDAKLAARFFQTNFDAMDRAVGGQPVWFLSMLIVPEEFERRGVDEELLRWGVEKADGEGWAAFGNATPETKSLYEEFGFRVAERHESDGDLVTHHMKREAKS